jgi:SAM-dependent methyltransferase
MPERISIDDGSLYHGYSNHIQRYGFAASICAGKRVLDAGCGTGYGSDYLARNGAAEVVAVDISEEALSEARRYYQRANLKFFKANVERLKEAAEIEGPFDIVVNFENLEHLQEPRLFIQEARRLLGEDGTLILSSPNGDLTERDERGQIKNVFHVREFNQEELIAVLQPEFPLLQLFGQWRTPEGRVRVKIEKNVFEMLNELYYNPAQRAWRAVKRVLGKLCAPPPEFTAAGTSYPWEFVIQPLSERPFPWPPEVILAIARPRS